jgi:L-asparaginase
MAVSFARLARAAYWPEPRRGAILRVQRAMTTHPEMVGYRHNNLDTDVMRAGSGSLLSKGGAEGVYCAARVSANGEQPALGLALKILDGDTSGRARRPAALEALRQAGFLDAHALDKLDPYRIEEVRNRPGDLVGTVRPAFTLGME